MQLCRINLNGNKKKCEKFNGIHLTKGELNHSNEL